MILTFFMFPHSWLQRAIVDDYFRRRDARRAGRLASAAAARLPSGHLLRTGTTDHFTTELISSAHLSFLNV